MESHELDWETARLQNHQQQQLMVLLDNHTEEEADAQVEETDVDALLQAHQEAQTQKDTQEAEKTLIDSGKLERISLTRAISHLASCSGTLPTLLLAWQETLGMDSHLKTLTGTCISTGTQLCTKVPTQKIVTTTLTSHSSGKTQWTESEPPSELRSLVNEQTPGTESSSGQDVLEENLSTQTSPTSVMNDTNVEFLTSITKRLQLICSNLKTVQAVLNHLKLALKEQEASWKPATKPGSKSTQSQQSNSSAKTRTKRSHTGTCIQEQSGSSSATSSTTSTCGDQLTQERLNGQQPNSNDLSSSQQWIDSESSTRTSTTESSSTICPSSTSQGRHKSTSSTTKLTGTSTADTPMQRSLQEQEKSSQATNRSVKFSSMTPPSEGGARKSKSKETPTATSDKSKTLTEGPTKKKSKTTTLTSTADATSAVGTEPSSKPRRKLTQEEKEAAANKRWITMAMKDPGYKAWVEEKQSCGKWQRKIEESESEEDSDATEWSEPEDPLELELALEQELHQEMSDSNEE